MKNVIFSLVVGMMVMAGSSAYAREPARNVSASVHPNIAAAQNLSRQAYLKIVKAQRANSNDLDGHAQRAKELLIQANDEMKAAALASNRNR